MLTYDADTLDRWLATAVAVAVAAGERILEYYHAEVVVHIKGGDSRNLVTDADLVADAAITEALKAAFPDHAVLSEEGYTPGDSFDDEVPTWIVDPIDGTSNFAHRLPLFAVSIGLAYRGEILVGVIHAPVMGWTFAAARGRGARLNEQPLLVSNRAEIPAAIVCCDWSRQPDLRQRVIATHADFAEVAHTMRSMGSAALGLAAIAAGWVDVYFNFSLFPWDTAAGALLIQEAGGQITALDGSPWRPWTRGILASNGAIHGAALPTIAPHLP